MNRIDRTDTTGSVERGGALVLAALSGDAVGHLAFALRRYLAYARSVGLAVPDEIHTMERVCTSNATGGQGETELGSTVAGINDRPMEPLTVTYTAAAAVLSVSKRTVARMVADGKLKTVVVGGRPRIPRTELERLAATA